MIYLNKRMLVNNVEKYDCIIVGGGISGLTFGLQSLKKNKKVLIIEKRNLKTTDKLCGGLLTKKSYDLLSQIINIQDLKITHHNTVKVHNDEQIISLKVDIYTLNRSDLDNYLLSLYKERGGKILEKTSYDNLDIAKNVITINNHKYKYDYLVVADGVNSSIRKKIAGRPQRKHFALEIKNRSPKDLEVFFNKQFKGYSWIIPNHKNSMIGLGEVTGKDNILGEFQKYLKELNIASDNIRGAYLPSGDDFFFCYNNVYFIGDAAGLASYLTGEGIYYALLSAYILSENLNEHYPKKMRKYLIDLRIAKFYSHFVYSPFWRQLVFEHHNFFPFKLALKIFIKKML